MKTVKFVYGQDKDFWIGYLHDYPDFMTQGLSFEELKDNLKDIYNDIIQGHIPLHTQIGEFVVV